MPTVVAVRSTDADHRPGEMFRAPRCQNVERQHIIDPPGTMSRARGQRRPGKLLEPFRDRQSPGALGDGSYQCGVQARIQVGWQAQHAAHLTQDCERIWIPAAARCQILVEHSQHGLQDNGRPGFRDERPEGIPHCAEVRGLGGDDFEECGGRFRILLDNVFRPLMDGLATDQAEEEGRPVVGRFQRVVRQGSIYELYP
jgi:hypothetical protein